VGDRARLEGTLGGAGIGAAVGGAVGAIGGIGGYAYADQIDKRHAALAGKEHDLDARIAFARGVNEDTEKCNRLLKDEVTKLESRIADVEARTKQGTMTQEKQAKAKQVLTEKIKDANQQLTLVDNELQGLKEFRAQQTQRSEALDEEIRKLEVNLAQMRTSTRALASLNQRI